MRRSGDCGSPAPACSTAPAYRALAAGDNYGQLRCSVARRAARGAGMDRTDRQRPAVRPLRPAALIAAGADPPPAAALDREVRGARRRHGSRRSPVPGCSVAPARRVVVAGEDRGQLRHSAAMTEREAPAWAAPIASVGPIGHTARSQHRRPGPYRSPALGCSAAAACRPAQAATFAASCDTRLLRPACAIAHRGLLGCYSSPATARRLDTPHERDARQKRTAGVGSSRGRKGRFRAPAWPQTPSPCNLAAKEAWRCLVASAGPQSSFECDQAARPAVRA